MSEIVEQPETALIETNEITPLLMLSQAVKNGADVDVLERLMALQERWETRQAQKAFTEALSQVRKELPKIIKSHEVRYNETSYKHEDLGDIVEQVSPVLGKHGLSFRWRTNSPENQKFVVVSCIIEHSEGHHELTTLSGPYDSSGGKNAIQSVGSVVTYLQRYTLKAALGIAASRDDDGQQGNKGGGDVEGGDITTATENQIKRLNEQLTWAVGHKLITQEQADKTLTWAATASGGAVGREIGTWKERAKRYELSHDCVAAIREGYEDGRLTEDEAREFFKNVRLFVMDNIDEDIDRYKREIESLAASRPGPDDEPDPQGDDFPDMEPEPTEPDDAPPGYTEEERVEPEGATEDTKITGDTIETAEDAISRLSELNNMPQDEPIGEYGFTVLEAVANWSNCSFFHVKNLIRSQWKPVDMEEGAKFPYWDAPASTVNKVADLLLGYIDKKASKVSGDKE